MVCPNCDKEARIADVALTNADTYGQSVKAVTACCGMVLRVSPVRTYRLECTGAEQDDWGNRRYDY